MRRPGECFRRRCSPAGRSRAATLGPPGRVAGVGLPDGRTGSAGPAEPGRRPGWTCGGSDCFPRSGTAEKGWGSPSWRSDWTPIARSVFRSPHCASVRGRWSCSIRCSQRITSAADCGPLLRRLWPWPVAGDVRERPARRIDRLGRGQGTDPDHHLGVGVVAALHLERRSTDQQRPQGCRQ